MTTKSVIAAQGYTVREFAKTPADVAKTLGKLKKIGFDALQISAFAPMDPKEMAKMLNGEGLACCATHTGWDRLAGDTEKVAEEHAILGCRHTAPGGLPQAYRNAEGYPKFAREMSEVGRKMAKLGMTLSYHNHAFELERFPKEGGRRGLDVLIEDSDAKATNFEIDTYWVQYGGADPAAYIRKVKGRIPLIHLKDMTVRDNKPIMAEVGEGNLNWPAILAAAKDAGVEWYIIEQDTCERDPFDALAISLKNLRAMGLH